MAGTSPVITGTFLPPNVTSDHWVQADFNQEFSDMAAIGISTVILQLSLSEDFNSAEYPGPYPASNPVNTLAAPAAPTVTPTGTAGTTTWQYQVTALNTYGQTTASPTGTTATGNATLTAGNYNALSWTAVTGATSYDVYRYNGTAFVYIANTATATLHDTGLTATTAVPPTTNTAWPPYTMTNAYAAMMLNAANTYGSQVWLGLANVSAWYTHATDSDGGAAWFTAQLPIFESVATELYALYGANPAFAGWYIPFEIGSYVLSFPTAQTPMRNFFSALITYLHTNFPGVPVMVSPTPLGYSGVGPLAAATWASALLNVIPGIDVINSQDVLGTLSQSAGLAYVTALNTAIAGLSGTKPAQWSNPDMFDNTTGGTMAPAKLQSNLIAEAPYVAKFTGFSYWSQLGFRARDSLATSYYYDSYRDYWLGPAPWTFFYNGLKFGVGTNVQIKQVTGLADMAAVRAGDQARPNAHGMVGGADYLGARSITVDLSVTAGIYGSVGLALDAVKKAFAVVTDPANANPLVFRLPGQGGRLVNCRATKLATPIDVTYEAGMAAVTVQFDAVDPRIYSSVQQFAFIPCTGGTAFVSNTGNIAARPQAVLAGPCGSPTLTNVTTGQSITLTAGVGFGQAFAVDFDAHTITYQGTSMYSLISPGNQFWELAPGVTQVYYITSGAIPPVTWGLTLTWRNAWL